MPSNRYGPPDAQLMPLRTVLVDVTRITKPSAALLEALATHADSSSLRRLRQDQAQVAAASPSGDLERSPTRIVSRTASPAKAPTPAVAPRDSFGVSTAHRPYSRHLVVPIAMDNNANDDTFRRLVDPADRTSLGRKDEPSLAPTVAVTSSLLPKRRTRNVLAVKGFVPSSHGGASSSLSSPPRHGGSGDDDDAPIATTAADAVERAVKALPKLAEERNATPEAQRERLRLQRLTDASTRQRVVKGLVFGNKNNKIGTHTAPMEVTDGTGGSTTAPLPDLRVGTAPTNGSSDSPRLGFFEGVRRQYTALQLQHHAAVRQQQQQQQQQLFDQSLLLPERSVDTCPPSPVAVAQASGSGSRHGAFKQHQASHVPETVDWTGSSATDPRPTGGAGVAEAAQQRLKAVLASNGLQVEEPARSRKGTAPHAVKPINPRQAYLLAERLRTAHQRAAHGAGVGDASVAYHRPVRPPTQGRGAPAGLEGLLVRVKTDADEGVEPVLDAIRAARQQHQQHHAPTNKATHTPQQQLGPARRSVPEGSDLDAE